ncbi:LLM class flavin-dependent oxidoreductase [Paenibacillus amylolyticus]|nr:LLM class flavin-dependent oxidoreductase [Paenibacillus amylolyticus]
MPRTFIYARPHKRGRTGWNIVTSQVDTEARNFGRDKHPEHGTRYEMAQEFVDVVTALWDSWPQDSLVMNRASGTSVDESKLRIADYQGKWY